MQSDVDTLGAAALRLAAAGCYVFPCRPGGKLPATSHGFKDAARDPATIAGWWTALPAANIGLSAGATGLVVIDLDGGQGIDNWRQLREQHPGTPVTLTAATPGGAHLYYCADPKRPVGCSASRLAPKVDTRGLGGYVVAPPSRRPDGLYGWMPGPTELTELPVVPAWIIDALTDLGTPERGGTRSTPLWAQQRDPLNLRPHGQARSILTGLVSTVLDSAAGTRNSRLYWAARRAGEHIADGRLVRLQAVAALERAGRDCGLDDRECQRTIASALAGAR
ncbi:MAG: bifunctional DNA primase/polymerase [Mycobacteriales bacterium]